MRHPHFHRFLAAGLLVLAAGVAAPRADAFIMNQIQSIMRSLMDAVDGGINDVKRITGAVRDVVQIEAARAKRLLGDTGDSAGKAFREQQREVAREIRRGKFDGDAIKSRWEKEFAKAGARAESRVADRQDALKKAERQFNSQQKSVEKVQSKSAKRMEAQRKAFEKLVSRDTEGAIAKDYKRQVKSSEARVNRSRSGYSKDYQRRMEDAQKRYEKTVKRFQGRMPK